MVRSSNSDLYNRGVGSEDVLCPLGHQWGHSAVRCVLHKICNRCGAKGHHAKSCNQKVSEDQRTRTSGVHEINLEAEGLSEPLVPNIGSFVQVESEEKGHKTTKVKCDRNQLVGPEKKLLHVMGNLLITTKVSSCLWILGPRLTCLRNLYAKVLD